MDAMTDTQLLTRPARRGSRLLITSSALLAVAGAAGLTGVAMATLAMVSIARHRIDRMEVPPAVLARRHLRKARAAVSAGAGAWLREPVTTDAGISRFDSPPVRVT
jgi:hypothetical protein